MVFVTEALYCDSCNGREKDIANRYLKEIQLEIIDYQSRVAQASNSGLR